MFHLWLFFSEIQIDEVLEESVGELKDKLPILLVLNKKDLIKPGEIAKKLEVNLFYNVNYLQETNECVYVHVWERRLQNIGQKNIKSFVVLPFPSLIDMSREYGYWCQVHQDNHAIISETSKNWANSRLLRFYLSSNC